MADFNFHWWEARSYITQNPEFYQIEGFRPRDLSHKKDREKLGRMVQLRASGTVWASSYAKFIVLAVFHGQSDFGCNCS